MTYAALAIFTGIGAMEQRIEPIACGVSEALSRSDTAMAALARRNFKRVVYLGSGVLQGLAREAALKLLELTDGAIVTMFDSTMGFRHGPKTIVTDRTLIVVFVSNDPMTRSYDLDLMDELRRDGRAGALLAISAQAIEGDAIMIEDLAGASDAELVFPFVVPAQLFALHCSLALGLTPDQPNASGTVSRVVQGVRIHASAG
jgi:tagatose-6-phosphate ketose/aldose isomerase